MEFVDFKDNVKKHVLFLGHSYVRRMDNVNMCFNLDTDLVDVSFCGHVRATPLNLMRQIVENFDWILEEYGGPDILVLFIGSNDLVFEFDRTPSHLANLLLVICHMFYVRGVKRVLVPGCLPRYNRQFQRET